VTFKGFLSLVEIKTKVASIIPFLLGTFYAIYRFDTFNFSNFIIMLVSLLSIDMATTAINNYYDYKKAHKKHGYGYEVHNGIVNYNMKESSVLFTIFVLIIVAIIFGVLLFLNTNLIVLILGAISFLVGILYSFGPIPISRTPFGEIFSGVFMGFVIPFTSIYIHIYDVNIVNVILQNGLIDIKINMLEVIYIFLLSIPTITSIGNIMLANNICDIEEDIENKRYTLPVYIGKEKSLRLFKMLYYLGFMSIVLLLILRVLPIIAILTIGTVMIVNKNIHLFYVKQTKKDTFIIAVKNFVVINITLVFTLAISLILRRL